MGIKKFNDFIKSSYSIMENESNHYVLPEKVKSRLTEDGKGNYVFHHYSYSKRDVIKPTDGVGSDIVSKEELPALSSVGGVAQYYTMDSQKEPGTGPILHTILIPKDEVYYLQTDGLNFYNEAKERFNEVRPGQAFSPNYQAAWISKVANENGFKMLVSEWRGEDLRGQTTIPLVPEKENTGMKPRDEMRPGDLISVYGEKVKLISIEGNKITYEYLSGSKEGQMGSDVIASWNRRAIRKIYESRIFL